MTFASVLGSLFGGDNLFLTVPFFVFAALLSALFDRREGFRFISVIPLLLVILIAPLTLINIVLLAPTIFLIVRHLPPPNVQVNNFEYRTVFKKFLFLFVFAGMVIFFSNDVAGIEFELSSGTVLFAASFVVSFVIYSRMIRHDESVVNEFRFKIINITSLVGVMLAAYLLSTGIFLASMLNILRFIWLQLFSPIFGFTAWVVMTIITFITRIFYEDAVFEPNLAPNLGGTPTDADLLRLLEILEDGEAVAPFIVGIILTIIFITLFVLLLKMLKNTSKTPIIRDDGVEEERFSLVEEERKRILRRRRSHQQNSSQVRSIYRKFLAELQKADFEIEPHMTSLDVEEMVQKEIIASEIDVLREIYIKVRYAQRECNKDEVKRIKQIFKALCEEIH